MNLRVLIFISLAVNLALGALAWRQFHQVVATTPEITALTEAGHDMAEKKNEAVVSEKKVEVDVSENFSWATLASSDLKQYRDRLRGIGCPDAVVRRILTAEIEEQFVQRRRPLAEEFQRTFWDHLARHELKAGDAIEKPARSLDEERETLLTEVLGPETNSMPDSAAEARIAAAAEKNFAWLPPEKRRQLYEIGKKYRDQFDALNREIRSKSATGEKWNDDDRARQKKLQAEFLATRRAVFTPEEAAEFDLREDSGAASWASYLPDFEANEDEWRAGAKLRHDFDQAVAALTNNAPQSTHDQLQAALEEQMQSALGPERFAQYQTAKDGGYQQTRRITERYAAPALLAQEIYAMEKQALAAAGQMNSDQSLTPDARAAALAALQQETQQSLQQKLTGDIWSTYQRYRGDWLKNLTQLPAKQ